jgi:hypothetical protein
MTSNRSSIIQAANALLQDIRAYRVALFDTAEENRRQEAQLRCLETRKDHAETILRDSVEMRRALLYLPLSSSYNPTLPSVLEICINLFPGPSCVTKPRTSESASPGCYMLSIFEKDETALDVTQCLIRHFVHESIPNVSDKSLLTSITFWTGLLTADGFNGAKPLSLEAIYNRLRHFDKWTVKNPNAKVVDSSAWLNTEIFERHKILLEISAAFPDYLKNRLATHYKYAYLDNIALDPGGTPLATLRQKCKEWNKGTYDTNPPVTSGINLNSKEDNVLLGTVLQIDNALSPAFVKRYLNATDTSKYTPDDKQPKHPRGYRFVSNGHMQDSDLPVWLMFGDAATSSLFFSQYANQAELDLLRIVNFIHNLYCDFLNKELETQTNSAQIRKKWGLPELQEGYYDSLMTMVSNPVHSNYGLHDDGKIGLCTQDNEEDTSNDPDMYSKFNLVVPTVCIQNHQKRTTRIEFLDKRYPANAKPVDSVKCGVVTIHVQLIGVQKTCWHIVSTTIIKP